ncbi:cupin [Actinomycetospora sp. NBRC 106375]|nr:cupin [Actinomycetospora sp. NBRC 106375]
MVREAAQQRIAWIGGSVHHIVLDGAATDDRLAAFRSTMTGGAASPVHVHDHEDETVFVLDGAGIFWAGDQHWELGAGDTAFLPRRVPHSMLITSATADLLTVCTPGGMEAFYRAAGWDLREPVPEDWAVDMAALSAAAEACGQRVLGPPLTAGDRMPPRHLTDSSR